MKLSTKANILKESAVGQAKSLHEAAKRIPNVPDHFLVRTEALMETINALQNQLDKLPKEPLGSDEIDESIAYRAPTQ